MYGRWLRNSFIYLLILVAIAAIVYTVLQGGGDGEQKEDLDHFVQHAQDGEIEKVEVDGRNLDYKLTGEDDLKYTTKMEEGDTVRSVLQENGVDPGSPEYPQVEIQEASSWRTILSIFLQFLPILFIVAILFFFLRQAQGSNNQAMNFGKSRARMFSGSRPSVTFLDVAGVEEAKDELKEVVEFLKYPEKFAALGARIPKGVLLVGPPGTGKTLLAKAVAGEAGVPFFSISGSEFVEMFVGVGASRVRDLFDQAKRNSPCIVFVDEIDAVGRHRGAGLGGSHDEREQTLNQILVEMDGFDTNTNVIVVAATNRPDVDPALLRPGRFDRQVVLDRPDIKGRKAILDVHAKGKPLDTAVNLEIVAKQTPGFSGADLANLVNEAAILAARRGKKKVTMPELDEAVDRVIAGPERRSRVISKKEREIIAYHEAGHALVGYMLPNADPPYKISIVARGMAGGFTRFLPEEDRHLYSRSQLDDRLAAILGGLVAEEMVFGESTTGPSDDISKSTSMARQMVTQWGMSERLGPRTFGRKEEMVFLGREISEQRNYSDKVAEEIDEEVRQIIDKAYQTAKKLLTEHRDKLDTIVKSLLEEETIEGESLMGILTGTGLPGKKLPEDESPGTEERTPEPQKPVSPPKPGLAWDTPAAIDPD